MKEGTYNTIKHWDDDIVLKFMSNEVNTLINYLTSNNIQSLSFIDIGGNVGKWYDELSKRFTINHCEIIEPSKELCEYMGIKFKDNPNVTIHNFGLSNENGEFNFVQDTISSLENNGLDLSNEEVNLGLSAGRFDWDENDFDKTKFYSSDYYFENICKIPIKEIGFIKMDTENRDMEILLSMTNFLSNNKIRPVIMFERNCVHYMSLIDAQKLVDDFCDKVGYRHSNLEWSGDNVLLIPINETTNP